MFRHADGNILSQVLPVLDPSQLRRVFGPTVGAVFLSPEFPGTSGSPARRALRPPSAAMPRPGLLTLSPEQIAAIEARRLERTKRRIAARLEPVFLRELGEARARDALARHSIDEAVEDGHTLGIRSEAGLAKWCLLQVPSGGTIGRSPQIAGSMTSKRLDVPADRRIDHVFDRLRAMRMAAAAVGR